MKLIWAFLLTFTLFLPRPESYGPVGISGVMELSQEQGHLYFAEGNFKENERKEETPHQFQNIVFIVSQDYFKQRQLKSYQKINYPHWHGLLFHRKSHQLHAPHRGPPALHS